MSEQKRNNSLSLPKISPKKFDSKGFLKAAAAVHKILKEEQEAYIKEKLQNIDENNLPFRFL